MSLTVLFAYGPTILYPNGLGCSSGTDASTASVDQWRKQCMLCAWASGWIALSMWAVCVSQLLCCSIKAWFVYEPAVLFYQSMICVWASCCVVLWMRALWMRQLPCCSINARFVHDPMIGLVYRCLQERALSLEKEKEKENTQKSRKNYVGELFENLKLHE